MLLLQVFFFINYYFITNALLSAPALKVVLVFALDVLVLVTFMPLLCPFTLKSKSP